MPFWDIALRPVEWTLTGLGVVGCLYAADRFEVLPLKGKFAGAEFEFSTLGQQVTANDGLVTQLRTEMDKLKWDVAMLSDTATASEIDRDKILDLPMDNRTISDSLLSAETASGEAVIWLGTWDRTRDLWGDRTAVTATGGLPPPDRLAGADVTLTTDVNVRRVLPRNDDDYYRGIAVLGVARSGTVARISEITSFQRPTGLQYWARVTIDYAPKATLARSSEPAVAGK